MANYVSSLTGQQINDVMTQIDQGVPEGWAVGSKNGIPVSSSSVYYHNNAKYYAESSQASAARAEAAVPASTAGAVFFDRSQSLTNAQKGQAKSNIGAGSSNPNLLDNSWFLVNTRRQTSGDFTDGAYRMDRWLTTYSSQPASASWTWAEDGLLSITTGANVMYFAQVLENVDYLNGKTITASIMLSNGDIYSGSVTRANGTRQTIAASGIGISLAMFENNRVQLAIQPNKTFTVRAVKLELGGVSTLAYDVPPSYEEELIRCITSKAAPTDNLAGKVIGANCNPNLLDNPWFGERNRINQRGVTTLPTGTTSTPFIDRWKCTRVTGSLTEDGISFAWDGANGTNGNIIQIMDSDYRNNTLTVSANIDGNIYSFSAYHTTTEYKGFTINGKSVTMQFDNAQVDGEYYTRLVIFTNSTTAILVRSCKVEKGAVSTLINDVPPKYATELAKCQYYYERVLAPEGNMTMGTGSATATALFVSIKLTPKRVTPTMAVTGGLRAGSANLNINITNTPTWQAFDPGTGNGTLNFTQTGWTSGQFYRWGIVGLGYMEFFAEL